MCVHSEYKNVNGLDTLFCAKENMLCVKQYMCHNVGKRILSQDWKECVVLKRVDIPNGSNRVLFEIKGKLYIDFGNGTTKVFDNEFDVVPTHVYIVGNKLCLEKPILKPKTKKKQYNSKSRRSVELQNSTQYEK